MFGYESHKVATATIATNATVSEVVDIRGANKVAFEFPAFASLLAASTSNVYCQVSNTSTTSSFRRLVSDVYDGSSGVVDWEVASTSGDRIFESPAAGYAYCRIELAQTATGGIEPVVHVIK